DAVEVNEDVAAEDEVEVPASRRRLEQIQLTEFDHAADGFGDANSARHGRLLLEVLEDEMPWHPLDAIGLIYAGGGLHQRLRRQIRGENLNVSPRLIAKQLQRGHRNRVRFFPRRT